MMMDQNKSGQGRLTIGRDGCDVEMDLMKDK